MKSTFCTVQVICRQPICGEFEIFRACSARMKLPSFIERHVRKSQAAWAQSHKLSYSYYDDMGVVQVVYGATVWSDSHQLALLKSTCLPAFLLTLAFLFCFTLFLCGSWSWNHKTRGGRNLMANRVTKKVKLATKWTGSIWKAMVIYLKRWYFLLVNEFCISNMWGKKTGPVECVTEKTVETANTHYPTKFK